MGELTEGGMTRIAMTPPNGGLTGMLAPTETPQAWRGADPPRGGVLVGKYAVTA